MLGFLFLVSWRRCRAAAAGLAVGLLVLAIPYRRLFLSRALLVPLAGIGAVLACRRLVAPPLLEVLVRSRFRPPDGRRAPTSASMTSSRRSSVRNPLFGLGLNTFSVYYEFVTGKSNWGPHSFYVALIVETGLVGTVAFFLFLRYLFSRLSAHARSGRGCARGDPLGGAAAAGMGLTAALAGTMAANLFYLTMSSITSTRSAVLVLALPIVFGTVEAREVAS